MFNGTTVDALIYGWSPRFVYLDYRFTGKERDTESGLDYFGARYYSSNMGRFLSPDPSVLDRADPTNPQTLNLYAYALNNPLRYTDPTGLEAACHWGGNDWDDTPGNGGAGQGDCEQQGGTWEEVPGPETTVTVNGDTGDSSITVETWQPNPGEMIPYVSAGCSAVPTQSTQGSLQQNIKNAEAMKPAMPWSMSYFYSNVKNGGPQDYKQNKQMADVADAGTAPFMVKSPFEDFGNFNYGATAAAQGIPLSVALRAAGYAGQKAQGASAASAAKTAMGPAPYGDDPADQIQIQNGYNF
jgi:RHS repeat-associated protein